VWRLQQQTTLPDLQLAWWLFVLLSALWIPRQARWQRITRYGLVVMFALLALDHLPVKNRAINERCVAGQSSQM